MERRNKTRRSGFECCCCFGEGGKQGRRGSGKGEGHRQRGGVEGEGGLKKNGEDENEKDEGGVEKGEWAETSAGVSLKGEGVGEECVERQGGERGR